MLLVLDYLCTYKDVWITPSILIGVLALRPSWPLLRVPRIIPCSTMSDADCIGSQLIRSEETQIGGNAGSPGTAAWSRGHPGLAHCMLVMLFTVHMPL